jgi:hypothetical protein
MSHSYRDDPIANTCLTPHLAEVVQKRLTRWEFLQAASSLGVFAALPLAGCATTQTSAPPTFSRIGPLH